MGFALDSPIRSLENIILAKKYLIFIKYKSWMFAVIQPFVKVPAFVSLTCSRTRMAQMWVGGAAAEGTKAQCNV